jgi:predicted metal-dependent HD superfamily phosphohydrolase
MNILQKAENYVFALCKDKLSPDYIYHNFNHTLRVVNSAKIIIKEEELDDENAEMIVLAAIFHDIGYIEGAADHEDRGAKIAENFLIENDYPQEKAKQVANLIRMTKLGSEPNTHPEQIIRDADCAHFADKNFNSLSELLREEWKLTEGKSFTDLEWATANRKMLMQDHRFFTGYGKTTLQPLKEENLASLQETINNFQYGDSKKDKDKLNQKKLEKLERPERGIETMFRVALNNHTRLSEIADSKANILLSVNAIIISIALSSLIPKFGNPGSSHLIIPTLIMTVFSVICIIFAILSTRPKVTTGTFTRQDIIDKKVNLLFFGNFYKVPLEEYDWAMNEMMKDRDYLYSTLIKDLYFLGVVLDRKYKLLRITYNIFMIGIVVTVGAFVYALRGA